MKFFITLLLLSGIYFCFADTVIVEEQIPQIVFEQFYRELPQNIPVVLDFNTGRYTRSLERLFKGQLLNDGYVLFENTQENCLLLSIDYDENPVHRSSGFFIFRRSYQEEHHNFSFQLTRLPESRILDYDHLTLVTLNKQQRTNMRWYDPVLISAVIGTLAYLFYFGGS